MNKKKIILLIIIIALIIFCSIELCKFLIGFKFKNQFEFKKFYNNIENISDITISFYFQGATTPTEEKTINNNHVEQVLYLIKESKVTASYESWLNKSCTLLIINNKNNSKLKLYIKPNQININNSKTKYNINENEIGNIYNYLYDLYNDKI